LKCLNCGEEIPRVLRACARKNITSRSKRMLKLTDDKYKVQFNAIDKEIIRISIGEIFTTQQMLKKLGWQDISNGDKLRDFLGLKCCLGEIEIVKIGSGSAGNQYKRLIVPHIPCSFWDEKGCKNQWKVGLEGVHIEQQEEDNV